MFGNLTTEGLEDQVDRVGGNYGPVDTGIYLMTLKALYAGQSVKGAHSVTVIGDIDGKEYTETIYITNKEGQNWSPHRDNPKKRVPLPGFSVINNILLIVTGRPLAETQFSERKLEIFDFESRKRELKSVQCADGVLGEKVYVGIHNNLVNKNEDDGTGKYVPTAEERNENRIDAVFHPELKITVTEALNASKNGVDPEIDYFNKWEAANKNPDGTPKTRDLRRYGKDGNGGGTPSGNSGAPGAPQAGGTKAASTNSLFGGKK